MYCDVNRNAAFTISWNPTGMFARTRLFGQRTILSDGVKWCWCKWSFFFFWLGPLWEDFQASIISYHMNSEGLHTVSWCMFKIFRYNTFLQNNCPCWSVIQWTLSNYFSMNSLISWKLLQKQTFCSVTRTLILERYVTLEFFRTPSFFNDVGTNSVQLCGIWAQQKSQRQKYLRVRYH